MEPLFAASIAKVQRAKSFIAELATEQQRYAATSVRTRISIQNGQPQFHVEWDGTGLLPGIILGDAIHNLRSALDIMATDLAMIVGQNPEEAYFPFAADLASLRNSKKFKKFAKIGIDFAELLEAIAPYRGGNKAMRAMHDLDVQDKHRGLIVTLKVIDFDFEGEIDLDDPASHSLSGKADVIEYRFPDDSPMAGEPIIQSLEVLAKTVEGILEAFAALVAARK